MHYTPLGPAGVRGGAGTPFKPCFYQIHCGCLECKFAGVMKLKLSEGLRGKPDLSHAEVLADAAAAVQGLLRVNNEASLKACVHPRPLLLREAPQVCF